MWQEAQGAAGFGGPVAEMSGLTTRVTCPEPVAEARFIDGDLVDAEVVETTAGPRRP